MAVQEKKKFKRAKRKPTWRVVSLHDPLFAQIAAILQARGTPAGWRANLYQAACNNARPDYPARDVLLEIKNRLQHGALLSTILPKK